MSLYNRVSPPKSKDSINIPVTPEVIRTPKEFKEIEWNTVGSERSKHEPNMKKIGPDDAIIVKNYNQKSSRKGVA